MDIEMLSKINLKLKKELTKKNEEIESLKSNDKARFLEWSAQKTKANKAEAKIKLLEKEIAGLDEEIKRNKRAYQRLSEIVRSLSKSLYSASEAINNISGGI